MKRLLRLLVAAALIVSIPGPAFHEALAQTVRPNAGAAATAGATGTAAQAGVASVPLNVAQTPVSPVVVSQIAPAPQQISAQSVRPGAAAQANTPASAAAALPDAGVKPLASAIPQAIPENPTADVRELASLRREPVAGRRVSDQLQVPHGEALGGSGLRVRRLLRDPFAQKNGAEEVVRTPVVPPAGAPSTLAEATLEPVQGKEYNPSPSDWADASIYSLILDRFEKGEGSVTRGDPDNPHTVHGGNLKGVLARLDYIQKMGFTDLLISPVAQNPVDPSNGYYGYHKYWPVHFMAVDPDLGTMEDFKALVDEAHKRGMRVILDMVFNHSGPVFQYKGKPGWEGMDGPAKEINGWDYEVFPRELKDENAFVRRGPIDNWDDPTQHKNGDFPPDLRKFDLSGPPAQATMIHIAKWWIKTADIDGIRLDTYDHVDRGFWGRFTGEVKDYAKTLGKDNFLLLAELFSGDTGKLAHEMHQGGVNSMYHYPSYFRDIEALHGEVPTRKLEWSLGESMHAFREKARHLVRFLDNQDKPRFLREYDPVGMLKVALAYTLYSIGIPLVYYGTEQMLRHLGKEDLGFGTVREDLWRTEFKDGPVVEHLAKLNKLRSELPALRRGEEFVRWSDPNGAGIFAFSRIYEGEEVLVVMNTSGDARSATMFVDAALTPNESRFTDRLDPAYSVQAVSDLGVRVKVDVPPFGVRVLTRSLPQLASRPPPSVD